MSKRGRSTKVCASACYENGTIAGNLPYFDLFDVGKYKNYVLPSGRRFRASKNINESLFLFKLLLEERKYCMVEMDS